MSSSGTIKGPFGIDPLHYTLTLLFFLALFVIYLLLPKGYRVEYFGAYPKRYAWSARSRVARTRGSTTGTGTTGPSSTAVRPQHQQQAQSTTTGNVLIYGGGGDSISKGTTPTHRLAGALASASTSVTTSSKNFFTHDERTQQRRVRNAHYETSTTNKQDEVTVTFDANHPDSSKSRNSPTVVAAVSSNSQQQQQQQQQEEIVISAAMQQLRDPGVLIVAHGSKGKPKTVRLQLTETAITWRTETKKKGVDTSRVPPKLGKLHQVPLSHIMYVDVGKQTTALRRVENAHVPEALCFSLLTKEGSLDLEANSARERDALVACFSLVLDEVHAANWRDIYRGPSSDMPSSFDDFDNTSAAIKATGPTSTAAAMAVSNLD